MTLVSVIIPTVDRPAFLREAVASALAQTHREIELIIVLNGATPEAAEAARRHVDGNICVVEMERGPLAAARNYGMTFARGEWIAFLDDDDVWLPEKIATQLAAARESGADLVSCGFVKFDDRGDIPRSGLSSLPEGLSYAEALMLGNYLSGGSAALVRAPAIRSLGGFDPQLAAVEDWDMWRRLSWNHQICCVDRVLVRYRQHRTNMSRNHVLMLQGETRHFIKILEHTPKELHHMLPGAEARYFQALRRHLLAQRIPLGLIPAERIAEHITSLIRIVFLAVDKASFGLARITFDKMTRGRAHRNTVA